MHVGSPWDQTQASDSVRCMLGILHAWYFGADKTEHIIM